MSTHQQAIAPTLVPVWKYTFRCFTIRITNTKRQGRRGVQHLEAYGVVFPSGHVVIDADLPRRGYESMSDLLETLSQYGTVGIEEACEVSV